MITVSLLKLYKICPKINSRGYVLHLYPPHYGFRTYGQVSTSIITSDLTGKSFFRANPAPYLPVDSRYDASPHSEAHQEHPAEVLPKEEWLDLSHHKDEQCVEVPLPRLLGGIIGEIDQPTENAERTHVMKGLINIFEHIFCIAIFRQNFSKDSIIKKYLYDWKWHDYQ